MLHQLLTASSAVGQTAWARAVCSRLFALVQLKAGISNSVYIESKKFLLKFFIICPQDAEAESADPTDLAMLGIDPDDLAGFGN